MIKDLISFIKMRISRCKLALLWSDPSKQATGVTGELTRCYIFRITNEELISLHLLIKNKKFLTEYGSKSLCYFMLILLFVLSNILGDWGRNEECRIINDFVNDFKDTLNWESTLRTIFFSVISLYFQQKVIEFQVLDLTD